MFQVTKEPGNRICDQETRKNMKHQDILYAGVIVMTQ